MAKLVWVVLVFLLVGFFCFPARAQEKGSIKTFIFLRHAESEKGIMADPALSAAGKQQAANLAYFLADQRVSSIYSTPYQRTFGTVQPLAEGKKVMIETYEPLKGVELVEKLQKQKGSKIIVVVGHSNTVPAMVNALMGSDTVPPLDEDAYGAIYIVTQSKAAEPSMLILKLPSEQTRQNIE